MSALGSGPARRCRFCPAAVWREQMAVPEQLNEVFRVAAATQQAAVLPQRAEQLAILEVGQISLVWGDLGVPGP